MSKVEIMEMLKARVQFKERDYDLEDSYLDYKPRGGLTTGSVAVGARLRDELLSGRDDAQEEDVNELKQD